jgi:hypothetical protein
VVVATYNALSRRGKGIKVPETPLVVEALA